MFCGTRRSGKSFLLYQRIHGIIQQKDKPGFVYINFEDERFIEFDYSHFDLILESALELNNKNLYISLMRFKTSRDGKNLPVGWLIQVTGSILQEVTLKC